MEQQKRILSSLINDDQRAVSFAWLARELGVTALVSKSLLSDFVASSKHKLLVHYFISGDSKLNANTPTSSRIISVVPAEKLSAVKASLETVLSEHVFSVQRVSEDATPLSPLSAVSATVLSQVRALAGDSSSRGQQVRSSFHGLIEPPSDFKISASRQSGGGDKGRPIASSSTFGKPASTPSSEGVKKPVQSGGINAFFGKAASSASVPTPSSSSVPTPSTNTNIAKKGPTQQSMNFFGVKKTPAPIAAPVVVAKPVQSASMVVDEDEPEEIKPSSSSSSSSSSAEAGKVAGKSTKSKRTIVIDDEDDEEDDGEFDHAAFEFEREREKEAGKTKTSAVAIVGVPSVSVPSHDKDDDDDNIFGKEEDEEQAILPTSSSSSAAVTKATSSTSPKAAAKPRKPKAPKLPKYASAQIDDEVVVSGTLPGKSPPAKKGSLSKSIKKMTEGDGRKVKTKTYINDDGYMVTEDVLIDDEEEEAEAAEVEADKVEERKNKVKDDDDDDDMGDSLLSFKPSKSPSKAAVTKVVDTKVATKKSGLTSFFGSKK